MRRRVYYTCPFCGEKDFDREGLSVHLYKYCESPEVNRDYDIDNLEPSEIFLEE